MVSIRILTVFVLSVTLKTMLADDIFTDQDKKDAKVVLCGGCKDEKVQEKIGEFYKCIKDNFPDDYSKGETIFKGHKDDAEGCWTEMSDLLGEFRKGSEENFKKLIECFESNVPDRKLLESCHA